MPKSYLFCCCLPSQMYTQKIYNVIQCSYLLKKQCKSHHIGIFGINELFAFLKGEVFHSYLGFLGFKICFSFCIFFIASYKCLLSLCKDFIIIPMGFQMFPFIVQSRPHFSLFITGLALLFFQ